MGRREHAVVGRVACADLLVARRLDWVDSDVRGARRLARREASASRRALGRRRARRDLPRRHAAPQGSLRPAATRCGKCGSAAVLVSFPSGHASGAVVMFGVLATLGAERWPERTRQLWVGGACIAFAIGASRVVLNVHHASDVLAGWCLGLAWLAAVLLVRGSRRYPWAHGRDDAEPRSASRGDRGPARLGP